MKTNQGRLLAKAIGLAGFIGVSWMAPAQQIHRPIKSCGVAFNGFQASLERAMKDSWGSGTGQKAMIAFNKLGYGPLASSRSTPQDYQAMEATFGERFAQRALADLVERHLSYMNNHGHVEKVRQLVPYYRMDYRRISDEFFRIQKIKNPEARSNARRPFVRALRQAASLGTLAEASGGVINVRAVMKEFWFNHFNVDATKSFMHVMHYEHQLSRRVCGTFLDLLVTSASHPAMLQYLDNFRSRRGKINENYGRELLELYTLGIGPKTSAEPNSPYNQKTVTDASKLLTGWTFDRVEGKAPRFVFRSTNHDPSRPKIMGKIHPKGFAGGMSLLKDLANRYLTKKNICSKLSIELLGDNVPKSVIDGCISKWGKDGNLVAIYKYLLTRPRFWSGSNFHNSVKTPLELVVTGSRAMGYGVATLDGPKHLKGMLDSVIKLGMVPRRVAPPTGYPSVGIAWVNPNYAAEAVNYGWKYADDRLPLTHNNRKYHGDAKEIQLLRMSDNQGANPTVDAYLLNSLKTHPLGYWADAGRPLLRDALYRSDYDKKSRLNLPARTINSMILSSSNFIRK
ncbi:MAG: DUF1800 family protein [Pseudomonadota bacterium]